MLAVETAPPTVESFTVTGDGTLAGGQVLHGLPLLHPATDRLPSDHARLSVTWLFTLWESLGNVNLQWVEIK